jgi:hypothetical protein
MKSYAVYEKTQYGWGLIGYVQARNRSQARYMIGNRMGIEHFGLRAVLAGGSE